MTRSNQATKGDHVRFTGGVYEGKTGWLDTSRDETPCYVYVIVLMENREEKPTRVTKKFVQDWMTKPKSYEEAVLITIFHPPGVRLNRREL